MPLKCHVIDFKTDAAVLRSDYIFLKTTATRDIRGGLPGVLMRGWGSVFPVNEVINSHKGVVKIEYKNAWILSFYEVNDYICSVVPKCACVWRTYQRKCFRVLCGKFADFLWKKDSDILFRSCIDYAVRPFLGTDTPYQSECGVLSVVYFFQGSAKPSTR